MAVKFCSDCGQKVAESERYCTHCGTLLQDKSEDPPIARVADLPESHPGVMGQVPKPFRDEDEDENGDDGWDVESAAARKKEDGKSHSPDDEAKEKLHKTLNLVDKNFLTTMLACSFKNAPLDTEFVIARNQATGSTQILPLDAIHDFQGLEVVQRASAQFAMKGAFFNMMSHHVRGYLQNTIVEEAVDAYSNQSDKITLMLMLILSFDPEEWQFTEKKFAGKWCNSVYTTSNLKGEDLDEKVWLVSLATPPLLSGKMMKDNLRRFEGTLNQLKGANEETEKDIQEMKEATRIALEAIPDTFARVIQVMATCYQGNETLLPTQIEQEVSEDKTQVKASGQAERPLRISEDLLADIQRRLSPAGRNPSKIASHAALAPQTMQSLRIAAPSLKMQQVLHAPFGRQFR